MNKLKRYMKKLLLVVIIMIISTGVYAQIEAPVKWSYAAKRLGSNEAVVFLRATIQDGWHIYSQNVKEGGPIKTSFTFSPSGEYSLIGKTTEPEAITKYEKVFSMDVSYFEKTVTFQQKIKLKSANASVVKGKLEYMTCNDKKCLPPDDIDFSIPLGK
jgi:DsbC/DsbD-like thiol-disulfide interchange protein